MLGLVLEPAKSLICGKFSSQINVMKIELKRFKILILFSYPKTLKEMSSQRLTCRKAIISGLALNRAR